MTARFTPIASIRRCGPNTFHEGEALSVVAEDEVAVRDAPDLVTIDQAHALVGRGEAVWIVPPRAGFQIRE